MATNDGAVTTMTSTLQKRPDAATFAIEDLVPLAHKGTLRIPGFQRLFKWRPTDIRDLFDSIYRGFPIGTLLFWKKRAEAGRFFLGPVMIDAKEQTDALWIVDGQQRLSSLVGVLAPTEDPTNGFDLYFDLAWEDAVDKEQRSPFLVPDARRAPEQSWLPLRVVLDSERLDAWLDESGIRGSHPEYVRRARRLNKLIREYKIPAYIVETDDTETLGLIFDRVNNAGRRLDRSEVFNALLKSTGEGFSLPEMAKRVQGLGFGELDQDLLLKVVLATHGFDITSASAKGLHEIREIDDAIVIAETALHKAIEFLRREAAIPHTALLPYGFPVIVLSRFFRLYPSPKPRSRALLSRWVWRGAISGEHRAERIPAVRAIIKGLGDDTRRDEEAAVQMLLDSVPRTRPEAELRPFRFGTAQSKLDLMALAALGPKNLVEGNPIDVGPLLEEHGSRAIIPITLAEDGTPGGTARMMSNLLIHPPIGRRVLLGALATASPEILMSHAIDALAGDALRNHDWGRVVELRDKTLGPYVSTFLDGHARWDESDRPSLASIAGIPEDDDDG